jgi:nucleotide-binding universal stress UspA family protein
VPARTENHHSKTAAPPQVVVGVDGSAGSRAAVRWALHWAAQRRAEVRVVAGYATVSSLDWLSVGYTVDLGILDAVHDDTWSTAREVVDQVREEDATLLSVPVALHVEPGHPADLLVRHSAEADLLVVGTRGRGAVASALLGSVALHCVSSSACPVVVVPEPGGWADPGRGAVVVAGVDGSARSAAAVAWAVEEAGPRGKVTAVRAYGVFDLWHDQCSAVTPTPAQRDAAELAALEQGLASLLEATIGEHAEVHRLSVGGEAGPALVGQAAGADLLVVASRGRGEFRGLVLGSVALYCVLHAPCPVLVVRPTDRAWAPGRLRTTAAVAAGARS